MTLSSVHLAAALPALARRHPPAARKRPSPQWHRYADLADCGTRCWVFPELDLRVFEPTREVLHAGQVVRLEPRPFGMLMLLLRRPDRLLPRTTLREVLWAGRPVHDESLNKCASKVRLALGGDATGLLGVVYGVGYRLARPPVAAGRTPAGLHWSQKSQDFSVGDRAGGR